MAGGVAALRQLQPSFPGEPCWFSHSSTATRVRITGMSSFSSSMLLTSPCVYCPRVVVDRWLCSRCNAAICGSCVRMGWPFACGHLICVACSSTMALDLCPDLYCSYVPARRLGARRSPQRYVARLTEPTARPPAIALLEPASPRARYRPILEPFCLHCSRRLGRSPTSPSPHSSNPLPPSLQ